MKQENFEKLKLALEQAVAIELGELLPARVTVREVPAKPARQIAAKPSTFRLRHCSRRSMAVSCARYPDCHHEK